MVNHAVESVYLKRDAAKMKEEVGRFLTSFLKAQEDFQDNSTTVCDIHFCFSSLKIHNLEAQLQHAKMMTSVRTRSQLVLLNDAMFASIR